MVQSNLTVPLLGNATQCELAPKHLVHISDSTFRRDSATSSSCGGSVMVQAAWLEVHRSRITGTGRTTAGIASALASTSSAVVLQDSLLTGHRSEGHGAAVFHKRGRLWASGTTFSDSIVMRNDGGGCLYIIDATEVKVSDCVFHKCSVPGGGGAILSQVMYEKMDFPPPMAIHASRFSHCSAGRDGGALNVLKMNLTVSDTVFEHNTVSEDIVSCGSRLYFTAAAPRVVGCCLLQTMCRRCIWSTCCAQTHALYCAVHSFEGSAVLHCCLH
jgi:hypothetical protein